MEWSLIDDIMYSYGVSVEEATRNIYRFCEALNATIGYPIYEQEKEEEICTTRLDQSLTLWLEL